MKILCISGHAQNGKDTVAKTMRKILWGDGERVLITHYADLVKYMCRYFFGWNGIKDEAGRSLLQYVGTDKVRAKEPDYWVEFIAHILELFPNEWDYVLIPDTRFPNEINYLKDKGFDVTHIHVVRSNFDNGLTEKQKSHPSETALNGMEADKVIYNNGTLVDLTRSVMECLAPIRRKKEEEDIERESYSGRTRDDV